MPCRTWCLGACTNWPARLPPAGMAAARGLTVTGITGTNGKTSCAQWLACPCCRATGTRCATIGTLGTGFLDALQATGFTTPDAVQLQASLADLQAGARPSPWRCRRTAWNRAGVAGTGFAVAVLTNLTQDHLDYHGTMAEYEAAEARLFQWDGLRAAVINRDDAMGRRLLAGNAAAVAAPQVIEYGIDGAAGASAARGQWLARRRGARHGRRHRLPPRRQLRQRRRDHADDRQVRRQQPAGRARRRAGAGRGVGCCASPRCAP